MKYLRNLKIVLPLIIILVISSIISIYYFGINLGTDYDKGIMISVELHGLTSGDIDSSLRSNFKTYEKINKLDDTYQILFINSDSVGSNSEKELIVATLKEIFKNNIVGEISAIDYTPQNIAYVKLRIQNITVFIVAVFTVFGLILYKKNELKMSEMLSLLIVDYIFFSLELLILFGGITFISQVNVFVDSLVITAMVFIMFIALAIKVFANLRFDDYLEVHANKNLNKTWAAYIDRDWPTIVFIFALLIIFIVTPLAVLGIQHLLIALCLIIVLVVAFVSEVTLKQSLLNGLAKVINKTPGLKLLQNKKW